MEQDEKTGHLKQTESLYVSLTNTGSGDVNANQLRLSTLQRVWELCGFEVETDFEIKHEGALLGYGERIYTAKSQRWWIAVDGVVDGTSGVLEFVIEARRQWDDLGPVIDEIVQFVQSVQATLLKNSQTFADLLKAGGLEGPTTRGSCRVSIREGRLELSWRGAPQATIGVPLHRLAEILVAARDIRLDEFELQKGLDLARGEADKRKKDVDDIVLEKVAHDLRPTEPSCALVLPQTALFRDRGIRDGVDLAIEWGIRMRAAAPSKVHSRDIDCAVGLMAMILRYLNEGFYSLRPAQYAKSLFAVMARTHFAAMFEYLGTAQQLFEEEIWRVVAQWSEGSSLEEMRVCRIGFRDVQLEREVKAAAKGGLQRGHRTAYGGIVQDDLSVTFHGPTIADWIRSVLKPSKCGSSEDKDLDRRLKSAYQKTSIESFLQGLSGKDLMSRGILAFSSVSMGLFGVVVIERIPFVVVEFRQWPSWSIEPRYWKRLLGRIWTFFFQNCWARVTSESELKLNLTELGSLDLKVLRQLGGDWSLLGNGECLFESVLASGRVPNNPETNEPHTPASLRRLVALELQNHWAQYVGFLPNDVELGDDMQAIVENAARYLAKPGNWARAVADLAPLALANALGQEILILRPFGQTPYSVGPTGTDPIVVRYNGHDHYSPGDL
jgi:hypothetical protein